MLKEVGMTLFLCLVAVAVVGCNNEESEESRTQRGVQTQDQRTHQAIDKLADAQNAVIHWRPGLSGKDPDRRIFSAELAPILVRSDGRPILFIADVLDVSSTGKDYLCSFKADVNVYQKIVLILGCTPEQASQIMKGPEGNYAVVARVTSLGSAGPKPDGDDDEKGSARFRAYGICLGQLYLGSYYLDDIMEMLSIPKKETDR
jgi:hypothetical protein